MFHICILHDKVPAQKTKLFPFLWHISLLISGCDFDLFHTSNKFLSKISQRAASHSIKHPCWGLPGLHTASPCIGHFSLRLVWTLLVTGLWVLKACFRWITRVQEGLLRRRQFFLLSGKFLVNDVAVCRYSIHRAINVQRHLRVSIVVLDQLVW